MDTRSLLRRVKPVPGWQFAAFRVLFGVYLVVHFTALVPYGPELFSSAGVLSDPRLNPTHGILPNPLARWDSPDKVTAFLVALTALAALFTLGAFRRSSAVLLWFGWACLFDRNNLISNPSIPYVGLLLLLCALVPAGEPFRVGRRARDWYFPAAVFWTPWALMTIGYTFSGLAKLASPSWLDGTALLHLVNNPLARPGLPRDLFLLAPGWFHAVSTWLTLGAEIMFLPLSLHARTRPVAWGALLAMHLGILALVDFADLSLGMVMLHLFTFDPGWLPAKWRDRASPEAPAPRTSTTGC